MATSTTTAARAAKKDAADAFRREAARRVTAQRMAEYDALYTRMFAAGRSVAGSAN